MLPMEQEARHKAEMARVLAKVEQRYQQALAVASGDMTVATVADSAAAVAAVATSKAVAMTEEASFPTPPSMESSESGVSGPPSPRRSKPGVGGGSGGGAGGKLAPVVEGLTPEEALEQAQKAIDELKEKVGLDVVVFQRRMTHETLAVLKRSAALTSSQS